MHMQIRDSFERPSRFPGMPIPRVPIETRPQTGGTITVAQWAQEWIERYKRPFVKPSTCRIYEGILRRMILPPLGETALCRLEPTAIRAHLSALGERYSPSTVQTQLTLLREMLKDAQESGLIGASPCEGIELCARKRVPSVRQVLSQSEQEIFLRAAHESRFCNLYRLALMTGLRIGELTALTDADVATARRMLHVRRTLSFFPKEGWHIQTPKTASSERALPLTEKMIAIIKEETFLREQNRTKNPAKWRESTVDGVSGFLFTTRTGGLLYCANIQRDLDRLQGIINERYLGDHPPLAHLHPHLFRHTFATRCFEAGIPPRVVQEFLGHSSLAMTMNLYTHVLDETKMREIKKLEAMMQSY